jgi:hypothetical protein
VSHDEWDRKLDTAFNAPKNYVDPDLPAVVSGFEPQRPTDTELLHWLLNQGMVAVLVYQNGWRSDVNPSVNVYGQLLGWYRAERAR